MPWISADISPPVLLTDIETHVSDIATAADTELTAANGRVTALGAVSWAPSAVLASNSLAKFTNLKQQALTQLTRVTVTPFDFGVGTRNKSYQYLSAPNAIDHLKKKLVDMRDEHRPTGDQEALVLLVVAGNYEQLITNLQALNQLLGLPELLQAEARARSLANLAETKVQKTVPALNPRFIPTPSLQLDCVASILETGSNGLSLVKSYEAQQANPLVDLNRLVELKAQQLTDIQTAITTLKAMFSGNAGYLLNLSGDLITGLSIDPPVGHEYVLSVATALIGDAAELALIREVFGL